jgi:hypothetical protein
MVQENLSLLVVGQAVGFLAMGIDLYAVTHKSDKRLIRLFVLSSLIFSVHYSLLLVWPAVVSELVTAFRFYISQKCKKKWLCFSFIFFYISLAFLFVADIWGVIPFAASILGTLGVFLCSGIKMRAFFIIGQALWFIYCMHVFSLGGIVLYAAMVVITGTTIFRLVKDKVT